jgi:hypothetical protein
MRRVVIWAFLLLSSATLLAQEPQGTPTRVRGTVERLEGSALTVKSRTGDTVALTLAPDFRVSGVVRKELGDIKPGDYVASTSMRGTDGKLHAIEVHFLTPAAPSGQSPYDLAPDSIMTNAIVEGVAAAPNGRSLKLSYKGGEAELVVGEDVPVVVAMPGDLTLVQPGRAIFVAALRRPDGTLVALRATVEKDGVKPPM